MRRLADIPERQDAEGVAAEVRAFLELYPGATVLEGGEAIFDLRTAHCRVETAGTRVLLQMWSEERNVVRRLLEARRKGTVLRLRVQRMGQREPSAMEMVAERGERLLLGREAERREYAVRLQRLLEREFAGWAMGALRTGTDLQHSFGPGYARGLQVQGQSAWAVVAVRAGETAAVVDGLLTVAILWLERCREQAGGRRLVEGVRLVLPAGMAATTLARVRWMDERIAKYEVYELEEREGRLQRLDPEDQGNVVTALARAMPAVRAGATEGRFAEEIARVMALLPADPPIEVSRTRSVLQGAGARRPGEGVELRLRSAAELEFLRYGLPFAHIRMGFAGSGFQRAMEVTVGSGAAETVLTAENAPELRAMVEELFRRREVQAEGGATAQRDVLFRTDPERWLESLLRREIEQVDAVLATEPVYVQVATASGERERGVVDLLAVTKEGRLAVIEVKADEDLHLPMQGLDYWIRVRAHQEAVDAGTGLSEMQRLGYFPETRLSGEPPVLYMVAPALRIHPMTEVILRHFDRRVPWVVVALDERWRSQVRPVWRKRSRA